MTADLIEIAPAGAIGELAETQRKLTDALARLGRTRDADVQIGTTPKDEVFRIDKTVLYRYLPMIETPSRSCSSMRWSGATP